MLVEQRFGVRRLGNPTIENRLESQNSVVPLLYEAQESLSVASWDSFGNPEGSALEEGRAGSGDSN